MIEVYLLFTSSMSQDIDVITNPSSPSRMTHQTYKPFIHDYLNAYQASKEKMVEYPLNQIMLRNFVVSFDTLIGRTRELSIIEEYVLLVHSVTTPIFCHSTRQQPMDLIQREILMENNNGITKGSTPRNTKRISVCIANIF